LQVKLISPGDGGVPGTVRGREHHEEGVGEHGQGGPAVPAAPATNLMLIQADQALAGLEALLNQPSRMPL